MQSWLEGRNCVGKCAQATGMTASLWILSSKANSNTWESLTRSELKLDRLCQKLLVAFYCSAIESVLTYCLTVWYGGCSGADKKALQRVIKNAQNIIGCPLPLLLDIANTRYLSRAKNIVKDFSHPGHHLFSLLPSGRRYRSIKHAQPDFQIVFIQEPFSPWTKDVLWTVQ